MNITKNIRKGIAYVTIGLGVLSMDLEKPNLESITESFMPQKANATMEINYDVACPVCLDSTTATGWLSTSTAGQRTDFKLCSLGMPTTHFELTYCSSCNTSLFRSDFDEHPNDLDKEELKKILEESVLVKNISKKEHISLVDKAKIADLCYSKIGRNDDFFANLYLLSSWLAQDEDNKEAENYFQTKAAKKLENIYTEESSWSIPYLVGELNRRTGNKEKALEWLSKSKKHSKNIEDKDHREGVEFLIDRQIIETNLDGCSENTYLDIIQNDPNYVKRRVALTHLIGIEDIGGFSIEYTNFRPNELSQEAKEVLTQIVLNGTDKVNRYYAINPLSKNPDPAMIPMFIKALEDDNFRVVQNAANGLKNLKAESALDALFKALENNGIGEYAIISTIESIGTEEAKNRLEEFIQKQESEDN